MRNFFKFLAVFLPLSFHLVSEEKTEIVKIEVATLIWKDQVTSEKFKKTDKNLLIGEALSLEKIEEFEIKLDSIFKTTNSEEMVFDFDYLEDISEPAMLKEITNEEEIIEIPSFYRVIDPKEHELNGTMRRISNIPDLDLSNHKSWYQPLGDEISMPYVLVSDQENQCVIKVFKSRYPRVHAKCAMGPDSLSNTYIMTKSEFNVRSLINEFEFDKEKPDIRTIEKELYVIDEQRRISLNELHYFDHPKIGILIGVYSYPKQED